MKAACKVCGKIVGVAGTLPVVFYAEHRGAHPNSTKCGGSGQRLGKRERKKLARQPTPASYA